MRDRLQQLGPNNRQIPRQTFNGLVRLGNALQSITGPNVAAGPVGIRIGEARPRVNQVIPAAFRIYDAKLTGWEEPGHTYFTGRRIDAEGNELDPEDIIIYVRTYPDEDGDLEWLFPQVAIEGIRRGTNNVIRVWQKMRKVGEEVELVWECTDAFGLMCPPNRTSAALPPTIPPTDAEILDQQRRLSGGRECCD